VKCGFDAWLQHGLAESAGAAITANEMRIARNAWDASNAHALAASKEHA
jgi:hypothetical protein